ncbi:MAG: DMT family transporter [Paracoccaceae bacterium]
MTTDQSQPVRAAIWMIGAIVSFSAMAIAGRSLSVELDTFEIMLFRSAIGFVVVLLVAKGAGTIDQITMRSMHIHFVRNIAHFSGQNLWFFAIPLIPLAQVFALEFTSPIWAMFLAVVVLGESLTRIRMVSAAIGFVGVLIITQPWAATLSVGIIASGLAAVGFGAAAVFTRLLTRQVSVTCIMFWLTAMQLVFALICAGYDRDISWPTNDLWPWLVLVALAGLVAHFCITKALSIAPAAVVMPVDFVRLPVIAIIGFALYNESLNLPVIIGGVIIFAANYLNIAAERPK